MLRNVAQGLGISGPMGQSYKSKNIIQMGGGGIYFLHK
jgi:hypothetical protein